MIKSKGKYLAFIYASSSAGGLVQSWPCLGYTTSMFTATSRKLPNIDGVGIT
jgi:hypothetical protein